MTIKGRVNFAGQAVSVNGWLMMQVTFVKDNVIACSWSKEFQERIVDKLTTEERIALKSQILEAIQDTLNRVFVTTLEVN